MRDHWFSVAAQDIANYVKVQADLDRKQSELDEKNHELFLNMEANGRAIQERLQNLENDHQNLKNGHQNLKNGHQNLKNDHQNLKNDHQNLKNGHQNLKKAHEDLSTTISLIFPRDLIERLVIWRHQLVEVSKGKHVMIAVGKRRFPDKSLYKIAKDGDYEVHGGGAIRDKTAFIRDHLQWTRRLLQDLDLNDQSCLGETFQKTFCFHSLQDYDSKLIYDFYLK